MTRSACGATTTRNTALAGPSAISAQPAHRVTPIAAFPAKTPLENTALLQHPCKMLRMGAAVVVALGLIDAANGFQGHATAALRVRARLVCRRPVALSHLRCGVDRGDFRLGNASSLNETCPEAAPPSLPRVPNVCSLFLLHGIGWQQELISASCRVRLPRVRSQERLRGAA